MGGMHAKPSVAVLIHHASQWPQALSTCTALSETGATVALYCLGQALIGMDASPPEDLAFECYADTCQIGIDCLSLQEIARRLKHSDLVIPI
jgi:hypothetical protein